MEEQVIEYRKSTRNKFSELMSNIGTGHIFLFGILFLFVIAMGNSKIDQKYNYVIYFILIGIIITLYFKPSKIKSIIPAEVAAKIAQEKLNDMIREGKRFSFDSKVFITDVCHLKYQNDFISGEFSIPVSWDVGFVEHVRGSQFKKDGVIRIHPYEGIVTGITKMPMGYTGRESRDRDIIPVGIIEGKMKTSDFGSPSSPS